MNAKEMNDIVPTPSCPTPARVTVLLQGKGATEL